MHGRMRRRAAEAITLLSSLAATASAQVRSVELRRGLVITSSVRIRPRVYRLPAPASLDSALIVIRGDDVTVDFAGATLEGIAPSADPDLAAGVAIRIEGGRNVTIRNAHVRGYKIAVMARGTRGLSLVDNELSYNWKPRLYSLVEHESLADWLSHHHNEKDEWLRFGAGIYLSGVVGGDVHGNRIVQGMEGLMLTQSDSLRIWNNVFSFNSGVGIGLYRSSDNTIMHNRVDYNVRGYSHGFYRRGQDSADLLIYEQSCRNVVAYNSMTHGGDGLFLWAGQQTMDTGEGGANDNLFYENDFSFAPTNGMEATFSRNVFARNRIEGSDHGLWGGYSFDSRVLANDFIGNRIGIAIEHGQENRIADNRFDRDGTAIQLWANRVEPSDWQYPKHRDTRSTGYHIERNEIVGEHVALRVSDTRASEVADNRIMHTDTAFVLKDTTGVTLRGNDTTADVRAGDASWPRPRSGTGDAGQLAPPPIAGASTMAGDSLARRDRSAIIVTEWGPYDWRSPLLWPMDSSRRTPLPLRVLGPRGAWKVVGQRGVVRLSKQRGAMGDTLVVTPAADGDDWQIDLEYRGAATVSPRGEGRPAGAPYHFSYGRFEARVSWNARFFAWSDSTDPRTRAKPFATLLETSPVVTQQTPRLDYMWYSPTLKGVPQSKLAVVATGRVSLATGIFTLRTISDDGVRVWIDGRLAIDDWTPHESAVDVAALVGGTHDIRVEYYQVDGWTELRLDIVRGTQRAGGSPGPH
jgi:parallel beta-helix repeat protein